MTLLVKSQTGVLWYSGVDTASVDREIVSAGNRVCLRCYGMYSFGDAALNPNKLFTTQANFRTTSNSSAILFSDLAPQLSWTANMNAILCMVEVPGEGILFEDGLFIELEAVTTRDDDMNTLLQVVYS
ncbi:MAG: hypothetical protein CL489_16725 [Acidobacteria bacterium]|nr:hypothetical protein [Acidobacteriota bacterium]|tara:strand:- start:2875 stop:3258 length:384 start_codon:yes stop_codon:yes gene_type:complete